MRAIGLVWLLFSLFLLLVTRAGPASAAHLEFVDPLTGFLYSYTGTAGDDGCVGFCQTLGPLFVKEQALLDVVGVQVELLPGSVTGAGWARAGNGGASYQTIGEVVIVPDGGESIGDPVTVYVHSKAFLDGNVNADVFHRVFLEGATLWEQRYTDMLDPGWSRQTLPFGVQIGDVVLIQSNGLAPHDPVFPGATADGLLQVSFSAVPPPDPPIAVPLGPYVACLTSAALAWLGHRRLDGAASPRVG